MRTLSIAGGGRWAKVIQQVATKHNVDTEVYSRSNMATVQHLNDLSSDYVWVANLADDHYETVKQLLLQSKNVLCEKPFVRTLEQRNELVKLAELQGCALKIGYEFEYSSAVQSIVESVSANVQTVDFVWHSQNNIQRHGDKFVSDQTLTVFEDIASHVLIILRKILRTEDFKLTHIEQTENGVKFSMIAENDFNETVINVDLQRNTKTHRRLTIDGVDYDFSADSTTLDKQLINFLNDKPSANEAQLTRWIDEFIIYGVNTLRQQHLDIVRFNKLNNIKDIVGVYISKLLIDNGLIHSRYDSLLDNYLQHTVDIIECYKVNPFVTQQHIQNTLGISQEKLIQLNIVLQQSEFIQECIVNDIRNAQYWNNTIIPLTQSGTVDRVINNEYGYPLRVGLHIGQSCMFWCHFCGRNMDTNAAYKKPQLRATTPDLVNLLQTAPNNDPYRFYLSGGLETLTNPDLMKLITAGSERGFKLSCYSNGFLLNEKYLNNNPELWDLEVLRISLYGSDAEVYEQVTKHPQGFKKVKQNVIDFLKYRKRNNKTLRFGFNYIILPGLEDDLLKVLDLIEEINQTADDQIDFITLRENFQKPNEADTFGDREKLKRVFEIVEERRASKHLNKLHIDYGYALNALRKGIDTPTMHCITDEQMLPKGFPQVDVVVDAYGSVYLCREAGFLDRPGNDRYIIGQVNSENSLEEVIQNWIQHGNPIDIQPGDTEFMDSYEHIVALVIKQTKADREFGIDESLGPIHSKILNNVNSPSIQAFYQGDKDAKVNSRVL
jgi:dTDP-4-amino-4,6-dideoxy-D-glucose ammonia-lyase